MNHNTLLNDFMKELVGNIQQQHDVRVIMSFDNARTHYLRRDVLSPMSSSSSHSSKSSANRISSGGYKIVPTINDCSAAPLPPSRKRSDVEKDESLSPSCDPSNGRVLSTKTANIHSKPPLLSPNRTCGVDDRFSSNSNNSSPKVSPTSECNVGVTRWQDDAMFSTDSQHFSAPPRAPASEDSPMFVLTTRKQLTSRNTKATTTTTTITQCNEATSVEMELTSPIHGNTKNITHCNVKQLHADIASPMSLSSYARSSYRTWRSSTKNLAEMSSYLCTTTSAATAATTATTRHREVGATSPVEALNEALDLVARTPIK